MTCFPLGEVPPIGGDRGAFPSGDSPVVKVFAADRPRCRRQAAITCGDRRHHNPLNLLNLLNPLNPSRKAAPMGVHFHRAKPGWPVFPFAPGARLFGFIIRGSLLYFKCCPPLPPSGGCNPRPEGPVPFS